MERFWKFVEKGPACWNWIGPSSKNSKWPYGVFFTHRENGKDYSVGAHRFSYEFHKGPIPKGLFILHKCSNPPCVNPDHLYAGTPADNSADMVRQNRQKKGEDLPTTKLTEPQVKEIRKLYIRGKYGCWKLGRRFGVTPGNILWIVNRKSWKHI